MVRAKDPFCGMAVNTKNPPAQARYKDKTYYFCALGCKMAFEDYPERYAEVSPNELLSSEQTSLEADRL